MAFRADKLREAREALSEHGRRVSQDRFAELLGVSRRSPGRWENGEAEPRMQQLSRIAEITGRPVGFFFDEPVRPTSSGENELLAVLYERLADGLREQADRIRADATEGQPR